MAKAHKKLKHYFKHEEHKQAVGQALKDLNQACDSGTRGTRFTWKDKINKLDVKCLKINARRPVLIDNSPTLFKGADEKK